MVSVASPELERDGAAGLPAAPSRAVLAWRDLAAGFGKSWMWSALALQDVKLRYRGSALGPFWLTLSILITVVTMGLIYARLFGLRTGAYLPYLTVGLIVWQFLAHTVSEGCEAFTREQSVIQQVPIPFSIHVYRAVCRNFLVTAHSFILVPIGIVAFSLPVGWRLLELVPAIALLALNGVWATTVLALLSTRFRDVPPLMMSFLQVLFFVTPVMWPADALGDWRPIGTLNPLFAAIDVIRAPILGVPTVDTSWPLLLAATALGCTLAFALFARFRSRIAYWI
jgi:ABC-type polysaccharide/polyol phosphate export permease